MNERDYRDDYRDYRNYRDDYRDYRDDYREDYREYRYNNRDRYGRNHRDRYGRNQREDYQTMLEDIVEDGMELARAYEDVAEMVNNTKDKQTLMKIAEKEKQHYRMVKEMAERNM